MKTFALSILGILLALGSTFSIALADENTATNQNNGANSTNTAIVGSVDIAVIAQGNVANITNGVFVSANTGGNTANGNTGGNVLVDTGDAAADVTIVNKANSNVANLSCSCSSDTNIAKNIGNGPLSCNLAAAMSIDAAAVLQGNLAGITNMSGSITNTGGNKANLNTKGTTTIKTGGATASANLKTKVNKNKATIGPTQSPVS